MRWRVLAPVLLVLAATAGGFVLTWIESDRDALLVLAGGLALTAVTGVLAATTERRKRALREVDQYFTLASEMVTIAGFDGYWTRVNPAVEAVLGYTEREALAIPVMELVHPDDRERREQETRRVVEGGTAHGVELRMLCKDGSYKWIEWTATPIPGERMMYGIGRDVTERRRNELEQAAVHRISTLVAQEVPQADVLGAIVEEIAALLGTEEIRILRFEGDTGAVVVGSSGHRDAFLLDSHQQLEGDSVASRVCRTGQPVRIDDYSAPVGPLADTARSIGIRAVVGVPVCVNERLWGAISVGSTDDEPLPPDIEARLLHFTELTATAIAKAEARDALALLAEEQAALRQVATLVAHESSPMEIFGAVTEEARRVLRCEVVGLLRFESDGAATLVAQSDTPWEPPPLGTRFTLDGDNVIVRLVLTGEPARVDDWAGSSGSVAAMASVLGVRSAVAFPVVVEGRLWGTIVAATSQSEPLPAGMESRLGQFTGLLATAIANAQARDALALLADEQAALRRVATLVAAQAAPDDIHAAVAEEVALLLAAHRCAVGRYEPDETLTVTGYWSMDGTDLPVGTQIPLEGDVVTATVRQSGRPIRIDSFEDLSGPVVDYAREVGPLPPSTVGAPIVVDGQAWGIIFVSSMTDPLPGNAESRVVLFTELIATAIVNADSRSALRKLAEEQAALRRVATLVAQQPSPEEIFEVVSVEVAHVFGFDADPASPDVAGVVRFEPGPALMAVGASKLGEAVKLGVRFPTDELYVSSHVLRTGRSARVGADDLDSVGGATADLFRHYGLLSQVGSPIVVEGRLWGAMTVNSGHDFPANTEERLERFTELIATAIANAESHDALARLADEQAALRRVATLVARGIGPEEVFRAVASEVGQLFGADVGAIVRFEDDGTVTVLGDVGGPHVSGKRVSLDEGYVVHRVRETGESSRFDTDDPSAPDMPSLVRTLGIRSSVASPIVVEGALWGAITAASVEDTLPSSAERRLTEFTELVATAIANTESKSELDASRRRIVAASDETRRQIERDLHDGTQQRLVSLGLALRAAEANVPSEQQGLQEELSHVVQGLADAVEDLQEISRGIHPAILSKGGLGPALRTLAHRSAIPVDLDIATDVRLAEPIEVAAYFVGSEALANAAKHSRASRIDVSLEQRDGTLQLSIRDDGVGGVDTTRGSGLVGLTDRVEALGGSIRVSSRQGEGTQITALLPLELELPQPA